MLLNSYKPHQKTVNRQRISLPDSRFMLFNRSFEEYSRASCPPAGIAVIKLHVLIDIQSVFMRCTCREVYRSCRGVLHLAEDGLPFGKFNTGIDAGMLWFKMLSFPEIRAFMEPHAASCQRSCDCIASAFRHLFLQGLYNTAVQDHARNIVQRHTVEIDRLFL